METTYRAGLGAGRELIRQDIAARVTETISYLTKLKTYHAFGDQRWRKYYAGFHERFFGLFLESHIFVKGNDAALTEIRTMLENPFQYDVKDMLQAFITYFEIIKKAGLVEIGWQERTLEEKMTMRG